MLVVALAVAALSCVVAVLALWRVVTLERRFRAVWGEGGDSGKVARELTAARTELRDARADAAAGLRRVALVRYDAFGDIGGRQSFSAALLDDSGDGLVLSSIHARNEARTYAKSIEDGRSSAELTPEEKQAVAAARAGKGTS